MRSSKQRMLVIVGAVTGAFMLNGCLAVVAGEIINGERRSNLARDERLRDLSAAALNVRATDLGVIGNKDWRDGVLYWTVGTPDGRQHNCHAQGEDTTARCTPTA